jgi:hypothetical protein
VNDWLQISGTLYALPAHRGEEQGSYLWLEAGEMREAIVAELFLPAVAPDRLDNSMGIATGTVQVHGEHRTGDVQLEFGRVGQQVGVLSADGSLLRADVRFELRHHPPGGGFCPRCGSPLTVDPISVITPPDGGLIGSPATRCDTCGASS